jgi:hypothetical protein
MLLLAVVVLLGACASNPDATSDSALKTGGAVPGEKTSEEGMSATAGPGSVGAGMHW